MTLENLIKEMLEFANDILWAAAEDTNGEHLVVNTALGNILVIVGGPGLNDTFSIYKNGRLVKSGDGQTIKEFLAYKVLLIVNK